MPNKKYDADKVSQMKQVLDSNSLTSIHKTNTYLSFLNKIILLILLSILALFTYWAFEPDPLEVKYVDNHGNWSLCKDRTYTLVRDVKTTRDITVHIKEYWWEIDGLYDIKGKMNEYPHKPITTYTLSEGTDRIFTFPKAVPKDLKQGRYRYRPHAEYEINPIKTIRKDLPVQYVNVVCDYDKEKYGVME